MARWQPGATQRLVVAAVDLFTEQGYDATTMTQIAERAGVTKSTFFRHFSDKPASSAMGPANRELGPRLKAAVVASTELQERDALKSVGLAAAMTAALIARGVPDPTVHLAGELGVLAFKRGYAQWSESDRDDTEGLAPHALAALEDLRAATASLG
ncbi:TetR/AcrR family transcriptional regulator [Streptomyces sp. NBC_01411]|uniref:helix-turn-helix domain-containing protein n=1 Tax=Streptomyces sp. NBC_01411 TaxID=2903857 RepID=UPI00324B812A